MATDPEYCDEEDILGDEINEERDPNFVEERFRVDRRKLEQMLQGQVLLKSEELAISIYWIVFCFDNQLIFFSLFIFIINNLNTQEENLIINLASVIISLWK